MSSIANPVSSTTGSGAHASTATSPTDPLASESTFLTLLVSQLQNQDPLNPVDSNQFVTQLTQYSQLEQLIGIHSDTTNLNKAATAGTTPASSAPPAAAAAAPVTANPLNVPSGAPADSNNLTTGEFN